MRDGDFEIGVLGAFSGDRRWPPGDRFLDVDLDEFDTVLHRSAPGAAVGLPFCGELRFERLDDFRPEAIAGRCQALAALLEARAAVGSPERARRLLAASGVAVPLEAPADLRREPRERVTEGGLLEAILADEPGRAPSVEAPSVDPAFDRLVAEIAEASADRTDYALQERWRGEIDAALASRLRAILRHPSVGGLEAIWRSLFGLVRHAAASATGRIRLRGIGGAADLADVALPEDRRFHLLVVDGRFGSDPEALRALADLAQRAGAPCLAAAAPDLCEKPDLLDPLRAHPGAARLGLYAPRLLLRLPYGEEGEPVDGFAFEESAEGEGYLWGSPAFAVAGAVLRSVDAGGGAGTLGEHCELADLPVHVRRGELETFSIGPTEEIFTETMVERLWEAGIVPVVGFRNRDDARIAGLRSVARTPLFEG